jgi:hypothetical protein
MEPVSISIRLDESQVEPGGQIRGRVSIRAVEPFVAKRFQVSLYWLAKNPRTGSDAVCVTEDLVSPGSECSAAMDRPFNFPAPVMPWSYDGNLFTIKWYVAVTVDPKGAKESTSEVEVTIRPS